MQIPKDRKGKDVKVGSRVRLLGLSGEWFENLPPDEKDDVLSMVGQVFEAKR